MKLFSSMKELTLTETLFVLVAFVVPMALSYSLFT